MSRDAVETVEEELNDTGGSAPGEEGINAAEAANGIRAYALGYVLALALTAASFLAVTTDFIYPPAVISALVVLAVGQMGVHLVFFLHITTGPDNLNNILALAFGVLIVALVVLGSIWIMSHLDHNMMPMNEMIMRQR